ncbi:hypothetical protein Cgig2_008566 [Carnegiea gigantea]|uniref:Uncharacterized protein n=1 Tax=Carnegiea gigantea TaxID=171969 RepID=A0A9Q1GRG0_9CARY|nr:hypothetical protein Cgig2_008566 [Carnegiea gigantea]
MTLAKRMGKRTFVPPGTLGVNWSQGLKNKHSHNGSPSVHEEENVSYATGEKGTPSVNMHNDSDFHTGANEDYHLTPLQPQGSTNKSVYTPSPDEEDREDEDGKEDERTVDPNIEQSAELNFRIYAVEIDGCNSMNNKTKRRNFKPRGPNRCKRLANLKNEEKLELIYFHNGRVGENHNVITRHMPVRLHSRNDIDESAKVHMWAALKDKFKGKDFELDREATLHHMKRLWHYWRGNLVQHYIKLAGSYEKASEKVPRNMLQEDCKWMLDEHFFNEDFLGGKEGKMPTVAKIFKET